MINEEVVAIENKTFLFPDLTLEANRILTINKIGNKSYDLLKKEIGETQTTETSDYMIHLKNNMIFEGKIMLINGSKENAVIYVGFCKRREVTGLCKIIKNFFNNKHIKKKNEDK